MESECDEFFVCGVVGLVGFDADWFKLACVDAVGEDGHRGGELDIVERGDDLIGVDEFGGVCFVDDLVVAAGGEHRGALLVGHGEVVAWGWVDAPDCGIVAAVQESS